jgi:hypothetical protein
VRRTTGACSSRACYTGSDWLQTSFSLLCFFIFSSILLFSCSILKGVLRTGLERFVNRFQKLDFDLKQFFKVCKYLGYNSKKK